MSEHKDTKILALITARSGSKGIKDKNIRLINGKPMLAYSVEHAIKSEYINRIILSTDSEKYAAIGKEYGAEIPFIRPYEYATDTALDIDVFKHALNWLKDNEGYIPDVVVHLRPTYPYRDPADIDKMIEMILNDPSADSVRSIMKNTVIPHKMWYLSDDGTIDPILKDIPEAYNMPRQQLPATYWHNGCIDVLRPRCVFDYDSMTGKRILGYEMKDMYDVDTEEEFDRVDKVISIREGGKKFVFDIDGVIALKREDLSYDKAEPNEEMIKIINALHDMGNSITLFTARGKVTGIDWTDVTKGQMDKWGVKYDELLMGKPNSDFYVDDKNLDLEFLYNEFKK